MFRSAVLALALTMPMFSAAHADTPDARPAFTLMDNTGDPSEVDVSFPVGIGLQNPLQTYRPRIAVQEIASTGFGGYGALQGAAAFEDGGNDPGYGIGNLELGALYHAALTANFDVAARVGLALPTLPGDPGPRVWNEFATATIRPADLATSSPGTWLRLAIAETFHRGIAFARADVGVDIVVAGRDLAWNDPAEIVHGNVGVGVALGRITATAELSYAQLLGVAGFGRDYVATTGASLRLTGGAWEPYLMISSPLVDYNGDYFTVGAGLTTLL